MKLLVLGDPHGKLPRNKKVFEGIESILITGDIGNCSIERGYFLKYSKFEKSWTEMVPKSEVRKAFLQNIGSSLRFVRKMPKDKPAFMVFGNADLKNKQIASKNGKFGFSLPLYNDDIRKMGIRILNNRKISFKGIKIAGLEYYLERGWLKDTGRDNARNIARAKKDEGKARNFLKNLGHVDIVLSHLPPYGFLDLVNNPHAKNVHGGSRLLLEYIKRNQPKIVLCGHIHEGKGEVMIGRTRVINVGYNGDFVLIEV